jgi:hypothetical protein
MQNLFTELFERDLQKLKTEINLYKTDEDLWKVDAQIPNSGGNLCLHLIGNLQHFIGANLDNTGFVRDRDAEFSSKNISRSELSGEIEKCLKIVASGLQNLSDEDFDADYPEKYREKNVKTAWMLTHLLSHLNYHLGQINYHRRFFTK